MCEFINWLVVSNGHFRGAVPGSILVKKKISDSCDIIIHNSVNFVAKRGGIVDGEWFGIRKTLLKVSTSHWLPSFLAYLTVSPEDTNIAPPHILVLMRKSYKTGWVCLVYGKVLTNFFLFYRRG